MRPLGPRRRAAWRETTSPSSEDSVPLLSLLFALATASASATPVLQWKPLEVVVRGEDLCYPSGYRVSLVKDPRADVISLTTVVDAGSAFDPPGLPGVAHLAEHLWFRARPDGATVRAHILRSGSDYNASTRLDTTTFASLGPRSALSDLVAMEAQRLLDPLAGLSQEEFEQERAVVANEHRMHDVEHTLERLSLLASRLFPATHPYHSFVEPTPEQVEGISLDQVRAFVSERWRPDRTTLLVIGQVTATEVNRELSQLVPDEVLWKPATGREPYTSCEQRAHPPVVPLLPFPASSTLDTVTRPDAVEPTLLLGWPLPAAWGEGEAILDSSPLWLEEFLAVAVAPSTADLLNKQPSCGFFPGELGSAVVCSIRLARAESAERVRDKAMGALKDFRLLSHEVQDRELSWFQLTLLGEFLSSLDDSSAVSGGATEGYAIYNHIHTSPDYYKSYVQGVASQNGEGLRELGRTWLRPELARSLLVLPDPASGGAAPKPGVQPAPELTQSTRVQGRADGAKGGAREEDAQQAIEAAKRRVAALRTFVLDNGLSVALLPTEGSSVVRAAVVFDGGPDREPKPGFAGMANQLIWSDGRVRIEGYGLTSLDRGLEVIGGSWSERSGMGWRADQMSATAGNLSGLVQVLRLAVDERKIAYGPDWLRANLQQGIDIMGDSEDTTAWWAERAWGRLLWGPTHPFAVSESERAWWGLSSYDPVRLKSWNKQQLRPDHAALYLTGAFDPSEAEALVRENFSSWKGGGGEPFPVLAPPPAPAARVVLTMDDPRAHMASILVGCRLAPSEDRSLELVASSVLDGRTWDVLRDNSNIAAYDPSGSVRMDRAGGTGATIAVTTPAAQTGLAVTVSLEILNGLSVAADPAAVHAAGLVNARGEALAWHGSGAVLSHLIEEGGPRAELGAFDAAVQRLLEVDPTEGVQLFAPCPGHEVISVTGPIEEIEASLRAQGFAPERLDREDQYARLRQRKGG